MSMTPPGLWFIDANLIMYAIGSPHPRRETCRNTLRRIKSEKNLVITNTEVLQEILYRYFSIGRASLAEIAYRSMVQLCAEILPVRLTDTEKALEILKTVERITSRDAIHAATMMNNGIKEIISTDAHFDQIPQITRIAPEDFKPE